MTEPSDPDAAKAALRRTALAARARAHAAAMAEPPATGAPARIAAALAGAIAALAPADAVLAGYMPMRSECDPLPVMAAHRGPVCVPVILGKGRALAFRRWSPAAEMVAGEFGALIPAQGEWLVPGVLIVPLVAFDARGFRLGYGGGFYDRTLAALRGAAGGGAEVRAIGLAYAGQEVPVVPTDRFDARLDAVVTEEGARFFSAE